MEQYQEAQKATQRYLESQEAFFGEANGVVGLVQNLTTEQRVSSVSHSVKNNPRLNGFDFPISIEALFIKLTHYYDSEGSKEAEEKAKAVAMGILEIVCQADSRYAYSLLEFYLTDPCLCIQPEFEMMEKISNRTRKLTQDNYRMGLAASRQYQ